MRCNSCGGVVGVDCFNPTECALIGEQQEEARHYSTEQAIESILGRIISLENTVAMLQSEVDNLFEVIKEID